MTHAENQPGRSQMALNSVMDLGTLVQDIVDGVYLGHAARQAMNQDALNQTGDATASVKQRTSSTEVIVLVDIQPGIDWRLETEVGAYKRILMNIFGNALKYTGEGIIEVVLRAEDIRTDGLSGSDTVKYVVMEVRDTGRGMSTTFQRERIFTPFAQEDTLAVGTGLGLRCVRSY